MHTLTCMHTYMYTLIQNPIHVYIITIHTYVSCAYKNACMHICMHSHKYTHMTRMHMRIYLDTKRYAHTIHCQASMREDFLHRQRSSFSARQVRGALVRVRVVHWAKLPQHPVECCMPGRRPWPFEEVAIRVCSQTCARFECAVVGSRKCILSV
jgi:hypothetical protein